MATQKILSVTINNTKETFEGTLEEIQEEFQEFLNDLQEEDEEFELLPEISTRKKAKEFVEAQATDVDESTTGVEVHRTVSSAKKDGSGNS